MTTENTQSNFLDKKLIYLGKMCTLCKNFTDLLIFLEILSYISLILHTYTLIHQNKFLWDWGLFY